MSINSSAFHIGLIETVESDYGRISFEEDQPYINAYFDLESVGNALDDLTSYFAKGLKVKAKLREAKSIATEDKIKAICVMLIEHDNSLIRGGDQYLKKFVEQNGPQDINLLPSILMEQSDNCPKFLRSNEIGNIKNVVLSRPDWFKIHDERVLCLVLVEETVRLKLLSLLKTMTKIGCDDIETIKAENKNMKDYLSPDNVKEFVSRHPSSFVYWNDYIWMTKSMLSDAEDGLLFQNDMLAVQYYSQFFVGNSKLTVNMLRGHFSQANELVKQAVKPKDSEFRSFLKRNPLFFQLDQDDNILCCQTMLHALDTYLPQRHTSTDGFKKNPSFSNGVVLDNKTRKPANSHKVFTEDKDICNQLQRYIKEHGALDCLELRENTDIATNNDKRSLPESLKELRDEDFERIAEKFPSTFNMKCQFLCLNVLEDLCQQKMHSLLQTSPMSATELALKMENHDDMMVYVSAHRPIKDGIYDFVSRNPESLIFWKREIFPREKIFEDLSKLLLFRSEMKAIQYYAQFMKVNSPTAIVSVRGHYAQACAEIRSAVHSRSEDFTHFLRQNDFYFDVTEESVVITKNHNRRIKSISHHWVDTNPQTLISTPESSENYQCSNDLNDGTTIAELNGETPAADNETKPLYSIQESRAFMEDNAGTPFPHISHRGGEDRMESRNGTGLGRIMFFSLGHMGQFLLTQHIMRRAL